MKIHVSGKGVDVGKSLSEHIEKRLHDGINKYLDRVNNVQVVVSRESHMFRVDISANIGTHAGLVIKGRTEGSDVYASFDAAADKIEKQLRRYKRRLTDHHKVKPGEALAALPPVKGTKYVLTDAEDAEDGAPVVIAEKATAIETLTVSEAVMKMDLLDLPALMFFNSGHGGLNVVYRRADGNISWVDPEAAARARKSA